MYMIDRLDMLDRLDLIYMMDRLDMLDRNNIFYVFNGEYNIFYDFTFPSQRARLGPLIEGVMDNDK